jgi:hypothetical protein
MMNLRVGRFTRIVGLLRCNKLRLGVFLNLDRLEAWSTGCFSVCFAEIYFLRYVSCQGCCGHVGLCADYSKSSVFAAERVRISALS